MMDPDRVYTPSPYVPPTSPVPVRVTRAIAANHVIQNRWPQSPVSSQPGSPGPSRGSRTRVRIDSDDGESSDGEDDMWVTETQRNYGLDPATPVVPAFVPPKSAPTPAQTSPELRLLIET